jgi:hypothetical protein
MASSSEEAAVISGAIDEFFSARWQEWNVGDLIALEPTWTTGQFDSLGFDKALTFWTIRFGNDGNTNDEETLKRIRETLDSAGSPPSQVGTVEKALESLDFGVRAIILPPSYFDQNSAWVPGAISTKPTAGGETSIRAKCALTYPLFSGDRHYAFVQLNHVKSGKESGQLHFFMVKVDGKWRSLAVGRTLEP